MEDKHLFINSTFYPVVFMFIVSVIFIGMLSIMYRFAEKSIELHKIEYYQLNIIKMFATDIASKSHQPRSTIISPANLKENFKNYIRSSTLPGSVEKYYVATINGEILGYCFNIKGSGLWGTMQGLLAVNQKLDKIIAFSIYDQMETPGLGARVEENWFKSQFAGKEIVQNDTLVNFTLISESAAIRSNGEIRQITGASITSESVVRMIKNEMTRIRAIFKGTKQL